MERAPCGHEPADREPVTYMGQTSEQGTRRPEAETPKHSAVCFTARRQEDIREGGVYAGEACGQFLNRPPAAVLGTGWKVGPRPQQPACVWREGSCKHSPRTGCWEGSGLSSRGGSPSGGLEAQEVGEWARQADAVTQPPYLSSQQSSWRSWPRRRRRTPRQSRPR